MPFFERDDTRIYYEICGDGPPVLALAPGGLQSSIPIWGGVSYNAVERLASVVASALAQLMRPRAKGVHTALSLLRSE